MKTDCGRERITKPHTKGHTKSSWYQGKQYWLNTRWMVKEDKEQNGHYCGYNNYAWVMLTSVFKLTSTMQAGIHMLVAACRLSMVSSVRTLMNKKQRPSKYKAQLFDCGVPGKISSPADTWDKQWWFQWGWDRSTEKNIWPKPRKLKKTSGVSYVLLQYLSSLDTVVHTHAGNSSKL